MPNMDINRSKWSICHISMIKTRKTWWHVFSQPCRCWLLPNILACSTHDNILACSATPGVGGWCYRSYNLRTWWMFRNTWGGGVMLPFLQLAHMVDVTQQLGWWGDVTVLTTSTHGGCYATHGVGGVMLPFLQLAHMVDVTQQLGWWGDVTVLTTSTHGGCYATHGVGGWCYRSYNLRTWSMLRNDWGGGVMLLFLQLAPMVDVPQQLGWGGDVTVLTTCKLIAVGSTWKSFALNKWKAAPDRRSMVDFGTEFISGSFVTTHASDNYNRRSCQKKKKAKKLFVVHASERLICCFPSSIGIHEPSFKNTRLQKAVLPKTCNDWKNSPFLFMFFGTP